VTPPPSTSTRAHAPRAQQLHDLRGLRGGVALVDIGDRRGADVAFAR
jgi:hypothetical protein